MTNKEIRNEILQYGFSRKSNTKEVLVLLVMLAAASLIIYFIVTEFKLEKVAWSNGFMIILYLGAAIVAYHQWRENRHEISIDKYYSFLGEANHWLECVKGMEKEQMHAYVELDKLEYVIVKYKLGFIPATFAKRAIDNFKCHCLRTEGFHSCIKRALSESAYLQQTKNIANIIYGECERDKSDNE